MSIQDRLDELSKGEFKRLIPDQPSSKMIRSVYASREVYAFLSDPKGPFGRPSGQAGLLLEAFINDNETTFRMDPGRKVSTIWARNAPVTSGICELRVIAPEPSVRIFGAFALTDTFVALTWQKRKLLDFGAAIPRARRQWDHHFNGLAPIISEDVHDYISSSVTAF